MITTTRTVDRIPSHRYVGPTRTRHDERSPRLLLLVALVIAPLTLAACRSLSNHENTWPRRAPRVRFCREAWTIEPQSPVLTTVSTEDRGTLELINEPADDYRSIDQLIVAAHHTIEMTMYELADPQIQSELVAAHRRGVSVRVLLDRDFQGATANRAAYAQLHSAGVSVRWAVPSTLVHQKTVTTDGSASAIMTGNLTARYYPTTRDFVVVDTQPQAVTAIEKVFDADWSGIRPRAGPTVGGLIWSPGAQSTLVGLIDSAQHTLSVENEEMDSTAIESALKRAARRGVIVRVTMTAAKPWDTALTVLRDAGIQVASYPYSSHVLFIHAKAMVVDGSTAELGSQNFSTSSLGHNRELGLITTDPKIVGALAATLAADFAGAMTTDRARARALPIWHRRHSP